MNGMPIASQLNAVTRLNSSAKDLLIYLYELAPLDADLLFLLLKTKKPLTLDEIAKKVSRDKTTVFRSVQKLIASGIVTRSTKTIAGGGYYHIYSSVDSQTFRLQTIRKLDELKASFDRIMQNFDKDISAAIASFSL